MKVCVFGAGGIGGYLAVRLAAAGHPVSVVARGAHLAAIRAHGLSLEQNDGQVVTAEVAASDDPAELGPHDLVVFGVKGHQLDEAIVAAAPLMAGGGTALPVLNGVGATETLEAAFGEGRALIGVARISAEIVRPGVIGKLDSETGLIVGDREGRQDTSPAREVIEMLNAAGAPSPATRNALAALWGKLVNWNGSGTLTAAARCDIGTIKRHPELRALYVALVSEALAVALAKGAPLPGDMAEKAAERLDDMPDAIRSSMAADLAAGRALEIDHLTGAIARMGREMGVPVPATEAMTAVLAPWKMGSAG